MPNEAAKMKPCPRCGKDMPVGGACPDEDCGFDEAEAERRAWGQAYINTRAREIEQEMADKKKKEKKGEKGSKKGLFS